MRCVIEACAEAAAAAAEAAAALAESSGGEALLSADMAKGEGEGEA